MFSCINTALLSVRASYFVFFFSLACFLPFLPVFLKDIGLNAKQAGIIAGMRPIVQFLFIPVWGFIADRWQSFRGVFIAVVTCGTLITFSTPWLAEAIKNNGATNLNATVNGSILHSNNSKMNLNEEDRSSVDTVFYVMLGILCWSACFDGAIPSLIDTAAIDRIKKLSSKKVDFGRIRLFGSLGFGIASLATGVGVQLISGKSTDYSIAFYLFLVANFLLVLLGFRLFSSTIKVASSQQSLVKAVCRLVFKFDVIFFLATIFVMGIANGILYGFMFWFLSDLGASELLMGLSVLVASLSEILIFPFTKQLIRMIGGNMPAIGLAAFSYGIRFLIMSFLSNPWLIIPLQLIHCVGFALFWSAAINQISDYSTKETQATMVAILNALHFGIGTGTAGIVGGHFYDHYGGVKVFRYSSGILFVWSLFVFIYLLLSLLYRNKDTKEECKSNVEMSTKEHEDGSKK